MKLMDMYHRVIVIAVCVAVSCVRLFGHVAMCGCAYRRGRSCRYGCRGDVIPVNQRREGGKKTYLQGGGTTLFKCVRAH